MKIKITRGGTFAHPDIVQWNNQLTVATDEIVDVEPAWAEMIIGLGRAVAVDTEPSAPVLEVEVVEPECVEVPTPEVVVEKPKRKPRRKAGVKKVKK